MRAVLVCVGRVKEKYLQAACAEYTKRLSRYGQVEVVEVKDEPEPANPSEALLARARQIEGERILAKIRPDDHVVALAIDGRGYTSEEFARHIEKLEQRGRIAFVIGGSTGLSEEVYARANERLSFSSMTFPHQLMRVIFLEQIYRACRISAGEPYHK